MVKISHRVWILSQESVLSSDALGDGDCDMFKDVGRRDNCSLDDGIGPIMRGDHHGGGRGGQGMGERSQGGGES